MNPTREESLFQAAVLLCGPARSVFLDGACEGDSTLRARLEALLAAHEEPPAQGASPTIRLDLVEPESDEAVGQTLGRYKILEKVGEGGCGVVYVAEQTEPVRRRVALKVIKLGMDTKQVVARFEAERQALAMMDHPSIAKVLDGGTTETGRVYFVMELVRGIPITAYCDQNHLTTKERLDLFMKVCHAIQHAHQKGIVHRDIKPSNILVTHHDGEPVPKVIDFGIAKAIGGRLTDATIYTQLHQFMGTPAYMSPEQAEMTSLDIDTRSDVYSLGVLLYEMLTGRPPFDPDTLMKAGLLEMRRIMREVEPPRPSTRLSTMAAADLIAVAHQRRVDPKKLGLLVRGDLDWIVMKALEKDRARRYETASRFADDIQNFLMHEPVSAVAPGAGYRFGKFVRRNRKAVATALTIVGLLLVGITTSSWLALKATRAQRLASKETLRATQVTRLLKEMLEGARPARARGQDTAMLRDILDRTTARLGNELRDQPDVEFEIRGVIGRTYEALGIYDSAESSQRAALALANRHYGGAHTNTGSALADLAFTLRLRGQFQEATNLFLESLAVFRRAGREDQPGSAAAMQRLGSLYSELAMFEQAGPLLDRAVEIRRRALGSDDRYTLTAELDLAAHYYRQGSLVDAALLTDRVVDTGKKVLGTEDPTVLNAMASLALIRQEQGRFSDAEALHLSLLEIKRRILGPDHLFTLTTMDHLAMVYGFQGRHAQAEELCRKAVEGARAKPGPEHRTTLAMQSNLAEYIRNQRRFSEAETLFRQVLEVQGRTMTPDDPYRLETENGLAICYLMQGRYTNAEPLLLDILGRRRARHPAGDPSVGDALAQVARLRLVQGRFAEAEPIATECLAIQSKVRPGDWREFVAQSQLGGCLLGLGRTSSAGSLLVPAVDGLKKIEGTIPAIDRVQISEAIERLIQLHEATGRTTDAARWRQELDQRRGTAEKRPSPSTPAGRP